MIFLLLPFPYPHVRRRLMDVISIRLEVEGVLLLQGCALPMQYKQREPKARTYQRYSWISTRPSTQSGIQVCCQNCGRKGSLAERGCGFAHSSSAGKYVWFKVDMPRAGSTSLLVSLKAACWHHFSFLFILTTWPRVY